MWGASRRCCCVLVYFPSLVLSDCNQTGDDTCKWRGDALWSKLWGNQTGHLWEFWLLVKEQLDSFKFTAAILPDKRAEHVINFSEAGHFSFRLFFPFLFPLLECVRATQTSAHLCCYKACKMKCAISCCPEKKCKMWRHQKNRFCTIQQAIIKVSASLSNSPVTLDTSPFFFAPSNLKNFLLTSVKGTCDQVKRNLTGALSGAGVKFWVKKMLIVIKPQHDAFYKSLSRTSRAQTGAGNNRECMLGDERVSSSHIMSRRLLSVRLLVCRVKRRQQRASTEPVWALRQEGLRQQPLLTSGRSRSLSPLSPCSTGSMELNKVLHI